MGRFSSHAVFSTKISCSKFGQFLSCLSILLFLSGGLVSLTSQSAVSAVNVWCRQHIGCSVLLLVNVCVSRSLYSEVELFSLSGVRCGWFSSLCCAILGHHLLLQFKCPFLKSVPRSGWTPCSRLFRDHVLVLCYSSQILDCVCWVLLKNLSNSTELWQGSECDL